MFQSGRAASGPRHPKVAFIQDGSRLHYAIPEAIESLGMLHSMWTPWYSTKHWSTDMVLAAARLLGKDKFTRMKNRRSEKLDESKIHRSIATLAWTELPVQLKLTREPLHPRHSRLVRQWVSRANLDKANVLMGFIRNLDPGLVADSKQRGLSTIGDQMIAPAAIERKEARIQQKSWPGWEDSNRSELEGKQELEERSWANLDHITCASDYVRQGLLNQGVEDRKITVIPYPVDTALYSYLDRRKRPGPVTVGFVGAVNLRKGAPYFLEVARRFEAGEVRFVMVGARKIDSAVLGQFRDHVEFVGRVPRHEIADWLAKFDIFFFPSTCEGSAGSVIEAMATGLPVVTSRNSGTIARDGEEGFIVPYDDLDTATERIEQLIDDPSLRHEMGMAGRRRVEACGLASYAQRLSSLLVKLVDNDG